MHWPWAVSPAGSTGDSCMAAAVAAVQPPAHTCSARQGLGAHAKGRLCLVHQPMWLQHAAEHADPGSSKTAPRGTQQAQQGVCPPGAGAAPSAGPGRRTCAKSVLSRVSTTASSGTASPPCTCTPAMSGCTRRVSPRALALLQHGPLQSKQDLPGLAGRQQQDPSAAAAARRLLQVWPRHCRIEGDVLQKLPAGLGEGRAGPAGRAAMNWSSCRGAQAAAAGGGLTGTAAGGRALGGGTLGCGRMMPEECRTEGSPEPGSSLTAMPPPILSAHHWVSALQSHHARQADRLWPTLAAPWPQSWQHPHMS